MNFSNYVINKDIPIPLYYQVKQIILDEINSGNIRSGAVIPTEKVFCDIYGISRTTIRQAITELVNEGYLYRIKSKGTFVSQPKIKTDLINMYEGYNTELFSLDMIPSTKLMKMNVIKSNKEQATNLQISEGDEVLSILRYRYADDISMGYIESFLKYPLCEFMMDKHTLNKYSLYELLGKNKFAKVRRITRTIEVSSANENESKFFGIKKGSPIHLCTNLGFSAENGMPVIYEILRYRGDKNKFSIDLYID